MCLVKDAGKAKAFEVAEVKPYAVSRYGSATIVKPGRGESEAHREGME